MNVNQNSVRYIYLYTEHKGQRYRVEIEVRVDDMARWLAARACSNRTKRARAAFGKATARPVKQEAAQ